MKDLEDPGLFARIGALQKMQEIRSRLRGVEEAYYPIAQERLAS